MKMRDGTLKETTDGFDYDPWAGSSIDNCVVECSKYACKFGVNITIRQFNGVDVLVTPKTTVQQALDAWQHQLNVNAEAYRNSDAGKKALQEQQERAAYCQSEVDRLLADVPRDLDALVAWIAEFSEVADHVSVKCDYKTLIEKLTSYGYRKNAHVTNDKNAVKHWTRNQHGEYIVGQAINCLIHGMPPHPITQEFAKEFMEMI